MPNAQSRRSRKARPLSRKQKIAVIVNQINAWDLDTIMDYAKDRMEEALKKCSPEELEDEYRNQVGE